MTGAFNYIRAGKHLCRALAVVCLVAVYVRAVEWPMFQSDAAHSANNSDDFIRLPMSTSWRYESGASLFGYSSAILTYKAVYATFPDGRISAFDKVSGALLWSAKIDGVAHSAPLYYNNVVFFAASDGVIYAFNASDGKTLWTYRTGGALSASPVVSGGLILFASNNGSMYALKSDTGEQVWKADLGSEYVQAAPVADNSAVYVAALNGNVFSLNKANGSMLWKTDMQAQPCSAPSTDGQVLFIAGCDGKIKALRTQDGVVAWIYELDAPASAALAVSQDAVHAVSRAGNVYTLRKSDGVLMWKFKMGAASYSAPAIIGNRLLAGADDQKLYVLSAIDGVLLSTASLTGKIISPIALSRGKAAFLDDKGNLNLLKSPNELPLQPTGALVDGRIGPAINSMEPVFNWVFRDSDPDDSQGGFKLQIAGAGRDFGSPVFDSGDVYSAESRFVLRDLLPDGTYYWRIRTSDLFEDAGGFTSGNDFFVWDRTAPVIGYSQAPVPNGSGWNNGNVILKFTCADGLSGVKSCPADITLSVEGVDISTSATGYDIAGNATHAEVSGIKIDKTAPLISASRSPAANEYGWTNQNVTVSYFCSDGLSGVQVCPSSRVFSSEGLNISTTAVVYDRAGNSSQVATPGISIDKTPPVTTAVTSGTQVNGWYNTLATITLVPADALSGVKWTEYSLLRSGVLVSSGVYIAPVITGLDGSYTMSYYGTDKAGNIEAAKSISFKIDRTAPQTGYTLIPAPNNAGWNKTAVQVVFSGTDTFSGGVVCSSAVVSVEGAGQLAPGWCRDAAGNIGYATATLNIDLTAPQVTSTQVPPKNSYGWNNSTVTVAFSGNDDISGVSYCSSGITIAAEISSQTVSGYCSNFAGLSSTASLTVNIDRSFPLSRIYLDGVIVATGSANLYMRPGASLAISANEPPVASQSGVAFTTFTVMQYVPSGWNTIGSGIYSDPLVPQQEGLYMLYYNSIDKADNWEPQRKRQVYVDTTAPVTTPYMDGLKVTSSTIMFVRPGTAISLVATDPLSNGAASGVDFTTYTITRFITPDWVVVDSGTYTEPLAVNGEEGHYMLYFQSRDKAGNWEPKRRREGYLDVTPPAIAISSPVAGKVFVATRGKINIGFEVTDNLDPAPVFSAFLEQVMDKGSPRGSRPARVTVSNGQAIEPLDIDDGIWQLTVSATDFADNAVVLSGGTFEVVHDVLAPRTSHSVTFGPSLAEGATTYITSAARLELASLDDLVLAGDGVGLGVKGQVVRLRSAGILAKELTFENPAPIQGESFVSSFTGAAFGLADGIYSLAYSASDVLGNMEAEKSFLVGLDNTAPVSTAVIAGVLGDNGWHVSIVTVSLSATDALSGVSGIAYRLDDNAFSSYTSVLETIGEGPHTVKFYAKDRLANTEAEKSSAFKLDRTPPSVTAVIAPSANADGWYNGAVTAGFAGTDAVSGIAYCESAKTLRAEGRGLELKGYCRDYAGLSSTVTTRFNIDLTSPTIAAARSPLANAHGWNNSDVTASYTCADVLSGVKFCPPDMVFGSEGVQQGTSGTAIDYAGNSSAAAITGINIDKTAPGSSLSTAGDLWQADGRKYLSLRSRITLAAEDPVSHGVASGIDIVEYHVDSDPFSVYSSSFGLNEGIRAVSYRSHDKAGNIEAAKTEEFSVDGTSPVTMLRIVGGMQYAGSEPGSFYTSLATRFDLPAADPVIGDVASGVKQTLWNDNGGAVANTTSGLAFAEGRHSLTYNSVDNVNNPEVARSTTILVDNTAPVTTQHIGSPGYAAGGVQYITPATPVTFAAADPVVNDVAAGVGRIEVSVDGGAFSAYSSALTFAEGRHTIRYRAVDNVGNTEVGKTLEVQSDNTPPVSGWAVSDGDSIEFGGKFYLNAVGKLALASADPVVANVASGVEGISYGIDTAPTDRYAATFTLTEGIRALNFNAKDNVGNAEMVRSTTIYVDGTKPVSTLSVSGDQYHGAKIYVSLRSDIILAASDPVVSEVASGVKATKYSVDGGAFGDYSVFKLAAEGKRLVSFYSTDRVGNVEIGKTSELWVDATAPVTELSINGARHDAGGLIYITKDSGIVLTSADPVSNEAASGVLLTKYRVDGGNWQVYAGSFTITAEGRHTLEFHSLDRVQNTEVVKTAALAVDNTPPATNVTLGEPKFEAFGLPVLTPATPITLAAADVLAGEVTSGLKSISYETVNVASGDSLVHNYTAPFTLPQGSYDLRYWSVDNLGNTEQYKQVRFSVSTFQNDSLQAVGGLDMSGTADISGAVKSNALVGLGGNARILGDVAASTITLTGKAQITGQQFSGQAVLSPEPIFLGAIAGSGGNSIPAAYLVDGKLVAGSQAELTLTTGTYYLKGIELAGGSKVRIEGQVDIMVAGDISLSGGSSLNAGGTASKLNIFVNTPSSITVTGGGDLLARVYAPYAHMKLAGNGLLGGHYFVRVAVISGTGNIIQAGETLPQTTSATGDTGGKKRVSAMASGDGTYQVLAGPDPSFRLGEVYVFPNPALRGAAPVLHIETGIADRVKITIYTVSGRQVHETVLTGMPVALDDGNGLSYAYEYTWRDAIPSGVYFYHIEAEKNGQKIKKSGKFGVVR